MPSTALIFIHAPTSDASSLANNHTTSLTSALITHISRKYRPKLLGGYFLDHRLLVETSSLLPGHVSPRRYTHFLTLASQFPGKTFVGTSASVSAAGPNGAANPTATNSADSLGEYTLITIPAQPDTLFPLMMQRMSSLWVPRQAHRVEGGTSFAIDDWKVRIGELKISGGQGQGRVRGTLCEVEFLGGADGEERDDEEIVEVLKAFFEGLAEDSGIDVSKMKVTEKVASKESELIQRYMDLLKFARG